MGLLVGTMDIATANNTVAIVMANPIAKRWLMIMILLQEKRLRFLIHFMYISRNNTIWCSDAGCHISGFRAWI